VDLYKTIRILHEERQRLTKLIESLERLEMSGAGAARRKPPARRGRKSMTAAERKQVSERMKNYWAARRNAASRTRSGAEKPGASGPA
jgi:hypothetical protein